MMAQTNDTQILHKHDLPLSGFAGLKEHQLVMDTRVHRGHKKPDTFDGIGGFIYLADAYFMPHGETGMHPHREVDVISVMVKGRISHGGSLGDGGELAAPNVQVQRGGGEGFTHNEINPDDVENRMIQLWVLPQQKGEPASYHIYTPKQGEVTCIYGTTTGQVTTIASDTVIKIALLNTGQAIQFDTPVMAYLTKGSGIANEIKINDGDLVKFNHLTFEATDDVQLIIIYVAG